MSSRIAFLFDSQYAPLHYAVASASIPMVETLVRLGCPVDLEDAQKVSVEKSE